MHVKITTSGSRRYVQLVESSRDDAGKVKKRTVATLGRLDLSRAMVQAALARRESRGAHWRSDFPHRDPAGDAR